MRSCSTLKGEVPLSAGETGAVAGTAGAALAQAIKASGVLVRVEPDDFLQILQRQKGALVVHTTGGILRTNYQYLTSYKGLAFFTKSPNPLELPSDTEWVQASQIWIPG